MIKQIDTITIDHKKRNRLGISMKEYSIIDVIDQAARYPDNEKTHWTNISLRFINKETGIHRETIKEIIKNSKWIIKKGDFMQINRFWFDQ